MKGHVRRKTCTRKNVAEGIARLLIGYTPGRTLERFFEEVGRPVEDRLGTAPFEAPPSMEEIVTIAAGYGIEIPPPPEEQSQAKESKCDVRGRCRDLTP
jgi:hypothetical protein